MSTFILKFTPRTISCLRELDSSNSRTVDFTTEEDASIEREGDICFTHTGIKTNPTLEVKMQIGNGFQFFWIPAPEQGWLR